MTTFIAPEDFKTILGKNLAGNDACEGILIDIEYSNAFENGMRIDRIESIIYSTVFPKNKYRVLSIKVKGDKPVITNEQLIQKQEVKVRFVNLKGRLYYNERLKDIAVSCTADSVEVI